ncbi:hypothetical protein QBC33DRAFT_596390 [Phialemonium atrogriseum]|uniref:MYND-type domain-containing protein n=1 Tax=Phialemonium atrogriseum TaxID=1093897 RepID=A0AAJ0BTK3_9PEZI|nr:uncharacterized protein QBC33DRAFT_596390 [Phialemonium atrogriseum]KAK1764035.1 hypothetical protein QBC33DRAFT_596390 [Phialemonium atrogriseum]
MLTPQLATVLKLFDPIGDTPAVCLTQGINPRDKHADILLLGCGDVRHILFTSHTDVRQMDITCCDVERAVLARNIILLTSILDDSNGRKNDDNWNIYYHMYLDQHRLDVLRAQATKLHGLFCDSGTLDKVRQIWDFYSTERKGHQQSAFKTSFRSSIQSSRFKRSNEHKGSLGILTSLRSGAPVCCLASCPCDPMFASPDNDAMLHYGTDPILGFHLSTAYAPLDAASPVVRLQEDIVAAARAEFRAWSDSFRSRSPGSFTMRVFAGDALAFSYTLQHRRATTTATSAHWYRDQHHLDPLTLDGDDYIPWGSAPLSFAVIDTSNLADRIGALNLLVAASPLLNGCSSASLYTDSIAKTSKIHPKPVDTLLCGHLPTVAVLLGLVPVEYWTNASFVSGGEKILDAAASKDSNKLVGGHAFVRTTWKRPISQRAGLGSPTPLQPLRFDESGLAQVLHRIYLQMFHGAGWSQSFASKLQSLFFPQLYNRPVFASLLCLVKSRVTVDWEKTMDILVGLIESNSNKLPLEVGYLQELYLYLHLLGVHSVDVHRRPFNTGPITTPTGDVRDWRNMPSAVCIILKVPRAILAAFTDDDPLKFFIKFGTPPVHCLVQSSSASTIKPWLNFFPTVQMGFGQLSASGARHSSDFKLHITDDPLGWHGDSPLFVSFRAPASVLLLEPRSAKISFGFQNSLATAKELANRFGPELKVFVTSLGDAEHVHISQDLPNQAGVMFGSGFATKDVAALSNPGARTVVTANADPATGRIASLIGRLDIFSDDLKSALAVGCRIRSVSLSPFNFLISVGKASPLKLDFPIPVMESKCKILLSRNSGYVEVLAPVVAEAWKKTLHSFMYPVLLDNRTPIPWNLPHLNLQALPLLNTSQPRKLKWLDQHVPFMYSKREQALRMDPSLPSLEGERTRANFKASLLTLFRDFAGLPGAHKAHTFGINNFAGGGIQMLVFVSGLRLDLANRTLVLDAAVLPIDRERTPQIDEHLPAPPDPGLGMISVDDAEPRLWKNVLPAWVERCRTWEHRPSCEYAVQGRVPLSVEVGEPVLCRCGNGVLQDRFMAGGANWRVISKQVVRVAISPLFTCPHVDETHDDACRVCNRDRAEGGSSLLTCAKCRTAKYCSSECQRANWKKHKTECTPTRLDSCE